MRRFSECCNIIAINMVNNICLSFFMCLAIGAPVYGRFIERCELARELESLGFPRDQLGNWVCLVESESSSYTDAVGGPNTDGSYDWGLFQINDFYWCNNADFAGKECNMRCGDLINDGIGDDAECVKLIHSRHGFDGWYGWVNKCQNGVPDVNGCFY